MKIRSRYSGYCKKCGEPYKIGDEIEWSHGSGAEHVVCPELPKDSFGISIGEYDGGSKFVPNTVIRLKNRHENQPEFVYVISAQTKYYAEDGLSFGVGYDRGYVFSATVRPATQEEITTYMNR